MKTSETHSSISSTWFGEDAVDQLLQWTVEGYKWIKKATNFLRILRSDSLFPDGLNHRTPQELVRYAEVLVFIAAADGELVREEIAIESMMGRAIIRPNANKNPSGVRTYPA